MLSHFLQFHLSLPISGRRNDTGEAERSDYRDRRVGGLAHG